MAKTPENIGKYQKDYDEKNFWEKVFQDSSSAGKVAISRALLLYYSISDLSRRQKTIVLGALGYLILPLDMIPDWSLVIGFADDLAALMFVFKKISDSISPLAKAKTREKLKEIYPTITEDELKKLGV